MTLKNRANFVNFSSFGEDSINFCLKTVLDPMAASKAKKKFAVPQKLNFNLRSDYFLVVVFFSEI